jgi:hypothetical protein
MDDMEAACARLPGSVVDGHAARYEIGDRVRPLDHEWVFEAVDVATGAPVIVVVLHPRVSQSAAVFLIEGTLLAGASKSKDPGFSRTLDAMMLGPPHRLPAIVFERPRGTTLALKLRAAAGVGLPASFVRRVLARLAHAVSCMHAPGVIHGRITPGNVWLDDDTVTLSLFRRYTRFRTHTAVPGMRGRGDGRIVLLDPEEAPYLAPEVVDAMAATPRPPKVEMVGPMALVRSHIEHAQSDVFSLAVLAFEMLTGRLPYALSETWAVGTARLGEPWSLAACFQARAGTKKSSALVRELEAVIARALAQAVVDRHPTVDDFWTDVRVPLAGARRLRRAPAAPLAKKKAPAFARRARTDRPPPSGVARRTPTGKAWNIWKVPVALDLVAGCFSKDGSRALAAGPSGLFSWVGPGWERLRFPPPDARRIRAIGIVPDDQIVLAGEDLVAWITPAGDLRPLPLRERGVTFRGVVAGENGFAMLVGERTSGGVTTGLFVSVSKWEIASWEPVQGSTSLSAITQIGPAEYLACGAGVLARLEGNSIAMRRLNLFLNLHGIAADAQRAFAVGDGGRVLFAPSEGGTTLQRVATDKPLTCVAIDEAGDAWTGGEGGVLARRREPGDLGAGKAGGWQLVKIMPETRSDVVALWSGQGRLRVMFRDGTFLQGVGQ